MTSRIVVIGAGLGGLATSAVLARAGHQVTVLEGQDWVGGKSRRIEVAGQRIDTGPSLVTFPDVLEQILDTYDEVGPATEKARDIAGITLERLPEVGRYYFKDQQANLVAPFQKGLALRVVRGAHQVAAKLIFQRVSILRLRLWPQSVADMGEALVSVEAHDLDR